MNKNISLTVSDSVVTIKARECEMRLPVDELYPALKHVFARRHLRMMLEEIGVADADIETIMDSETASVKWINSIENNESILECIRLTAEIIAEEALRGKEGLTDEAE